jgi:hypothetical protein
MTAQSSNFFSDPPVIQVINAVSSLTYQELDKSNPLNTNDDDLVNPFRLQISQPGAESNLKVKIGTSKCDKSDINCFLIQKQNSFSIADQRYASLVYEFKQFDFRSSTNGVLFGCYGYYNEPMQKFIATYYVADNKGRRNFKPNQMIKVYPDDG